MSELVTLLVASGGWLVAGLAIGARLWRRKPKPVKAICDCGHPLAMHDPDDGECHASDRTKDWYWQDEVKVYPECACRKYVGPQPIASMFDLPIATDKD